MSTQAEAEAEAARLTAAGTPCLVRQWHNGERAWFVVGEDYARLWPERTDDVCPSCGGTETTIQTMSCELINGTYHDGDWIECNACGLQGAVACWDVMRSGMGKAAFNAHWAAMVKTVVSGSG